MSRVDIEMDPMNVSYDYFPAISGKLYQINHVLERGIRNYLKSPQKEVSKYEQNSKWAEAVSSFGSHRARHTVQGQKVNIYLMINLKTGH